MESMTKPQLTTHEAETLAHNLYNISGSAKLLPGEWDANFHIKTEDKGYVLKVMHAEQNTAVLDLQCQALAHLAREAPDVGLPRVIPLENDELMRSVEINGRFHLVWLLTYVPGDVFAHATPKTPEMMVSFGHLLGRTDAALANFEHEAGERDLKWDMAKSGWVREHIHLIKDETRRGIIDCFIAEFEAVVYHKLITLRQSIIHNDANDYNTLVGAPLPHPRQVVSLIDFGDMMRSQTINNLAIAIAYGVMGQDDPLATAAQVVTGYHSAFPLIEQEVELLFSLIMTRLCVSVVNSTMRQLEDPADPYIVISQKPAWAALEKLQHVHPWLAHYTFRAACGWEAVPFETAVTTYLQSAEIGQLLSYDVSQKPVHMLDLSVSSLWLGANPDAVKTSNLSQKINNALAEAGLPVATGGYKEVRMLYANDMFASGSHPTNERRMVHMGIDFWCGVGTAVFAPLDGTVRILTNNDAPLDYGPLVVLEHQTDTGQSFFTLYGHLSELTLDMSQVGDSIKKGNKIAEVGPPPINGDWPPHLHFQIILDLLDMDEDFPGVAFASQLPVWESLSPNPNLICRIPEESFLEKQPPYEETMAHRKAKLGGNLSLSYNKPLKIVRGWMQYLYDENGRAFLDVYNNVPHVGHSHPQVVEAVQKQIGLLNSNTRYLHDNILRYADQLTSLLPDPLKVAFFVNSGSEANELALRLARTHTNQYDMLVMESAYHGHTNGLVDISPYKFAGKGGRGAKPWIHQVPIPDDYRGPFKRDDPNAGLKYAKQVEDEIRRLGEYGRKFAGYICETLPSVGGQIVLPKGYLKATYQAVRAAGGICIADEVQVGFGRIGTHFWGFESQDAVPDIVVFGKPIGNGFPLAAVVTTREIADSFNNGMEFFSTFGGNPVACAAGTAVLNIILEQNLQSHALEVGNHMLTGFDELKAKHSIIGDVRGSGLFLGLELVRNRETLEPATAETSYVVNRLREHGILTGTEGPFYNVIKIRPPMPFNLHDADFFMATIDKILAEDALKISIH